MKFTLSWLKEHLDTSASLETITETLTKIGLEVEDVLDQGAQLKDFIIAKIIEATPHPDADRLKVCRVDIGDGHIKQVVCGAPNARADMVGVFAPMGTTIPANNMILKPSKIRGIESEGMMCSTDELLLGESGGMIMELDTNTPVGTSFSSHKNLDDAIIEVGLTPNRGDCASVRGIARDLAAAGIGTLKSLPYEDIPGTFRSPITLHLDKEASKNCLFFMGRYIRGVKNGPSPKKLQDCLKAIGLTPISALVDITNYLTFNMGRPLHVFDAHKLVDQSVIIRQAHEEEKVLALNHEDYTLESTITVVADAKNAHGIAGIIGDSASSCTMETTDIFLECAYFDPEYIAKTGQKLGISTDARYCFERGVDPESIKIGIEAATNLIMTYCGGEASHILSVGTKPHIQKHISFSPNLVKKHTGAEVAVPEIISILTAIGCTVVEKSGALDVITPSWRHDISIPEDLVEEVIRLKGYDIIPTIVLPQRTIDPMTPAQRRIINSKHILAQQGLSEIITWSMVDEKAMGHFGHLNDALKITNPISEDLAYMRPSLMPNLLKNAKYHQDHSMSTLDIFEIEAVYNTPDSTGQEIVAGGLRKGEKAPNHWRAKNHPVDFYYVKRDILPLLKNYGLDPHKVQWSRDYLPHWYHPGQAATLHQGKKILGYVGMLHPKTLKLYGLKGAVAGFEIFLDRLPPLKAKKQKMPALKRSEFQSVARDFSFLMPENTLVDPIRKGIEKVDPKLISDVMVYDIFKGNDIDVGQKAITFRVHITPMDRTLKDDEIKTIYDRIIQNVVATGAIFRL